MIDDRARRSFEEQGHVAARRLFDADETAFLHDHFTRLRESGAYPGDVVGVEPSRMTRIEWTAARCISRKAVAAARAASGWTATAGP